MDFEKVLHKAKKNEKKKTKEPVNCYRTTFSPPKKEERTRGLSANIQKFLAKKDEEERRKKQEEDRKREELLALRNQDGKARKRVQVMLKRTKSANKSVLNDAIDTVNTADTINGPKQCDEDDYGYESQEASKFYNKMMEKYNAVPVEEKKSYKPNNRATAKDLVNTKDRVRQALLRQGEDEQIPHKRRRRQKEDEDNDDGKRSRSNSRDRSEEREKTEKPKPKRALMPPPLDFSSLLKIAEKKQFEPVVIEKKVVKVKEEPERLMTKKEKLEHERQKDREKKVSEYLKGTSSKSRSDDSPRNINGTRDHCSNTNKYSEKPRSKEDERGNDKNREKHRNQQPVEKNTHSSSKPSGLRYSPESHHSSQSRSRSRSPLNSKDRLSNGLAARSKLNPKISSSSADRYISGSAKSKDDVRKNSISSGEPKMAPTSFSRIPKIPRVNEDERKMTDRKILEKERMREKEKLEKAKEREREKDRERLKEKERERDREKEREREKEKERQKFKEKMEKEKQKEREKEKERLLERQKEADKEREKRDRLKEREYEKERERRERERREKEYNENVSRKSSSSSDKLKQSDPKKPSKYDKLDLFGERDSASPERPSVKTIRTSDNLKKNLPPVKTERIKVVEDTTRDLFENPVTIVRKQLNDKNADKSSSMKSTSSKPDEKSKLSSSSKAAPSNKSSIDKSRPSSSSDRKRDAEDRGSGSDKRPKLEPGSNPQSSKDNFKRPLPPLRAEPRKQFPPKDLQRKEFPPRDMERKEFPPRDMQRKEFPPRDLKPKQFPPRDLKPKQFPPRDLKSRPFPPSDVRRGSSAAKRFEYERSDSEDSSDEDEDEYDDLDGFIDDGPTDNAEDISRYIKDIFGYDKHKYLDDEGDIEVSSFAEQMREESRSARLGLIEDLEDMAMEQREKRRKALHRMKRGRR